MEASDPSFIFFRSRPGNDEARIALTSSMQSLDSVLLLIALGRFPHALITCQAAIESAIKSSPVGNTVPERANFPTLVEAAKRASPELSGLAGRALSELRTARNRMTHKGFSPRDDSESVGLLLEVGLPFLHQCYSSLFSFDLSEALLPEYVRQLEVGREVYDLGMKVAELDRSYCLKSLSHLIRWGLKENFSANWEIRELAKSEESGGGFEFRYRERQALERLFGPECVVGCPLCGYPEAVVCQLDEAELDSGNIVPKRSACTNCGFVVRVGELFLSQVLLRAEIAKAREAILKDYGL